KHLPSYEERVLLVPLDDGADPDEPTQARCYRRLAADLRVAVQQALCAGSKRLLGTYLQALLSYPDACTREETVLDPRTNEVLATNPRLVQTGLDLIDFPSVVWIEIDYSVYVLRQASRRSWRIGQRQPVEVTFLTYEGTLQAEALALVAAKTRASLMVAGELPEEGLAALDGDGGDVYLALA